MDAVELFRCFVMTVIIIFQYKGFCIILDDEILCEQSNVDILCPNETIITEVNISTLKPTLNQRFCKISNEDTKYTTNNETATKQCIGKRSCRISGTDIDFTQIPDQAWKLNVNYTCDHYEGGRLYSFKKPRKVICSDSMSNVGCTNSWKDIKIVSVNLETSESVCKIRNDSLCAHIIRNITEAVCNGKQNCDNINREAPNIGLNGCIRIPKYVNVSFLCLAEEYIMHTLPENDNSYLDQSLGIAVGVVSSLMIIGIFIAIYLYCMRNNWHKQRDNVKNNTQDYIGHQSIAFPSNESVFLPSVHGNGPKRKLDGNNYHDTSKTLQEDVYEYAQSIQNDEQPGYHNHEQESKTLYANIGATAQQNVDVTGAKKSKNSKLRQESEYSISHNDFDHEDDYDRICRMDIRQEVASDKFMSGDYVYSRTVDDEYDTAQISKGITKNQNYDHVVLE